jgi:hypothetical protein
MPRGSGWLSLIGLFGLAVAADAQTPLSQTTGSQFDGAYAFVSSTTLTAMYITELGRMLPCASQQAGPLTIVRDQARLSSVSSRGGRTEFQGTVGSQGELAMRSDNPSGGEVIIQMLLNGRIDGTGTVRARWRGRFCTYDLVWRK